MRHVAAALVAMSLVAGTVTFTWTSPVWAKSLYGSDVSPFSSMFSDTRARGVGDLVTILVMESSYAQNSTKTQSSKGIGVEAKPGVGWFDFIPALKLDGGNSARGTTETSRSGRLVGTITAQVTEVLPNGDLRIRGTREVSVNREKEQMIVVGTIRPKDISPQNTIPSTLVANAEISFSGGIYTGERGGIFKTLADGIVYLFNLIF
ncbi:MAG: flagellar basal body L-ring protein FlgH [Firmicutes bacterium]|nr:flagellar basal body L-ring protein FlgH [Bacillota bacterium]